MTGLEEQAIFAFLGRAEDRINNHTENLPFAPIRGRLVISWLRARLTTEGGHEKLRS